MRKERRILAAVLTIAAMATLLTSRSSADDVAFGEHLSSECVTCHRRDGQDKGIPPIIGWPIEQFIVVMQSYKAKERKNQVMQTIAGRLSADEIAALARFYANLQPKAP